MNKTELPKKGRTRFQKGRLSQYHSPRRERVAIRGETTPGRIEPSGNLCSDFDSDKAPAGMRSREIAEVYPGAANRLTNLCRHIREVDEEAGGDPVKEQNALRLHPVALGLPRRQGGKVGW